MARVVYDRTTPFGSILATNIDNLQKAKNDLVRLIGIANAMSNGGGTPAALEASKEFGVSTGGGQEFYNDLQNIKAGLDVITTLFELDQG